MGVPPILKDCTTYNGERRATEKLLKKFITACGPTKLPRSVIIVQDDGTRSYIPEEVLTPVAMFQYQTFPSDFLVKLASDEDDDSDGSNDSSDDSCSGDDDDSNSDDDDDSVTVQHLQPAPVGNLSDTDDSDSDDNNPIVGAQTVQQTQNVVDYLTELLPEARDLLEEELRFEAGLDGQGELI